MRVPAIERGRLRDRLLFGLIRVMSGHRAPDVVRTTRYRPHQFGRPFNHLIDEVMRGPSDWSVGERELFAAWVSKQNQCEF